MVLPGLSVGVGLVPPHVRPPPISVHNDGRSIQDMTGKALTLRADTPSKLAVLSHVWPIYATIDAGADHIVGLSKQARQFTSGGLIERVYPRIAALPQTGALPNVEQLMVWDPDVILTLKDASADILKAISFPGLFQMTFNGAGWREPIMNIWKALGRLDDREARAEAVIDRYDAVSKASSATTVNSVPIRAIAIWSFGDVWSIGARSYYLNEVFPLVGAINIAANVAFASVNIEQVLLMDPDVIFLGYFGDHPGPEKLFASNQGRPPGSAGVAVEV
jgi:ABC-type Fe3+-hydroxamate transport system substrate-binding protein